jgi:MFS transporter, ACS family, D-galactonate transporter
MQEADVEQVRRARAVPIAVALLVVSVFISYVDRGNLSIAAPLLKAELGLTPSQLGILLSGFFWSYTVMLFVCAALIERVAVSRLLAGGFLLWSLATAATGWTSSFAGLFVMRLLLGVGESVTFPCYSKILAQELPEARRGLANGAIIAGMKLGPAVGTLGLGLLITRFGWRPVFIIFGLASLLWLPLWKRWRLGANSSSIQLPSSPSVRTIFRQAPFWASALGAFCNAYVLYFLITWLPYYLVQEHSLPMGEMVKVAAAYYTIDAVSALLAGFLADRLIRGGLPPGLVRKAAMTIGWSTAGVALCGCAFAGEAHYLVWLFLLGLGAGTANSGLWAFTQTLAGARAAGRWTCLQNGFATLAGVIGPLLTGFTVQWTGHFQIALLVTASMCLVAVCVWLFMIGPFKEVTWTNIYSPSTRMASEAAQTNIVG